MRPVAMMAVVGFGASWTGAITDEEIFRDFRFQPQAPGARAQGVGGAFIALADDSTAMQANPAGLLKLRRPELFVELRVNRNDPSETATSAPLDFEFFRGEVEQGARTEPRTTHGPAFISYVRPFERWAIGFSRLESLRASTRTENRFDYRGQQAIVEFDPETGEPIIVGVVPVEFEHRAGGTIEALLDLYNFAVAYAPNDRVAFGITAVLGAVSLDGGVENLFVDRTAGPGDPYGSPTLDYRTAVDDRDTNLAFTLGVQVQPIHQLHLGVVYRQGHRFELTESIDRDGVNAREARRVFGSEFENVLHTPDSIGVGIAYRPVESLTLFLDRVETEYSDLLDDYRAGLNRITFPFVKARFDVEDAVEWRAGGEYLFLARGLPLAVRGGGWRDSAHRIHAVSKRRENLDTVFPRGESIWHYTLGAGVTIREAIQLDAAIDWSSVSQSLVISTIYRF